jgi:MYND finger
MPPSSSRKNTKSSGNEKRAIQKQIDDVNEKKLADEFMAASLGRAAGIREAPVGRAASKYPDSPPCDGCRQPFAGTMQCAQCQAVFYCCRDCQVSHWTSRHKAECAMMKEINEAMAKQVLEGFEGFEAFWFMLDMTSRYNAAVRHGLHDKIRHVMELDKTNCSAVRYRNDRSCMFFTERVMKILFRGQRAEGKVKSDTFPYKRMDGVRIKHYVRSHPDALTMWLQASVQVLHFVADRTMLGTADAQKACNAAVHVWDSWCMVFTSKVAAHAILTPFPSLGANASNGSSDSGIGKGSEQRSKMSEIHARRIVTILKDAYHLILSDAGRRSDPDTEMKTCISTATAMVQLRIQAYGIGIDVESILDLKGKEKLTYQHKSIAMARRWIEKGRKPTEQEMNAVSAAAFRKAGGTSQSISSNDMTPGGKDA